MCDLGFEPTALADAAVQTLAAQHADFDLDHIQPTGVFGRVVELQALQEAMRLWRGESLVQGAHAVGRKIVHDDLDAIRVGIVRIGEIAHAMGEVSRGSVIGHLHVPPGFVRVDEDEHIGRAVALVFAIVSLGWPGAGGIGKRVSPINWVGLSSKQTTGRLGSGSSA